MGDQAPGKDEGKGKAAKVSDTDAKTAEKKAASGPPGGKGDKKPEKEPDQKPDAKKDKKSKPAGKKSSSGFAVLVGAIVFFIAVVLVGQLILGPKKDIKGISSSAISIGGPFSLTDQNGSQVSDENYKGRFMLVYFGYTFCPEICLTALTNITKALDILGEDGSIVAPVFITVDPERDTPENIKEFISYFHSRMVGLTGSAEQVRAVAKSFQIYYKKVPQAGAEADDYLLDHTSIIYLMGPDGVFRVHFTNETTPEKMAERIREFL